MRVLNSNSWMKSPITQPYATPLLHTSSPWSSWFLNHSSMSPNQLACGHQGDLLFLLLLMCSPPLDQPPPFVFLTDNRSESLGVIELKSHITVTHITKCLPSIVTLIPTLFWLWMSCPNASCGLPIRCCLCPVCIFCCCPSHQHSPTRPPRRSSITRLSQQEKVHSTREITAKVHQQTHQTSSHSWEIPESSETNFSPGNHQGGEGQHPGCLWKWPRIEYRYFWIRWVKFSPITCPVENNSIGIMKSLKSGLVSDLAKLCQS